MIRNVAELLRDLQRKEIELIEKSGITHAPTIGEQYEGLTKSILDCMIPSQLDLKVVSGFVEGIDGSLSGQIDCMLVRGEGHQIPYSDSYKWPVRDVLAVFEIKKTLFSEELTDAHHQLNTVLERFIEHSENLTDVGDISPSLYMYGQIVGEPAPMLSEVDSLPFHKQAIFHTLVLEQIAPLRIIFGYQGFANEYTLRAGFIRFLRTHNNLIGYAGAAMPHLVVCGNNSLIKFNGHPYAQRLENDNLLWYGSSVENPLLLLLNLIFTKLMYLASVPDWFQSDLSMEQFAPLLSGKAVRAGAATSGIWSYTPILYTQTQLKRASETIQLHDWAPLKASAFQCVLATMVGNGLSRQTLKGIVAEFPDVDVDREIDEMTQHRILGWVGDKLVFLTIQCVTLFTSSGQAILGDADDPRLFEWLKRDRQRGRQAG
jgi:hypothetical protein